MRMGYLWTGQATMLKVTAQGKDVVRYRQAVNIRQVIMTAQEHYAGLVELVVSADNLLLYVFLVRMEKMDPIDTERIVWARCARPDYVAKDMKLECFILTDYYAAYDLWKGRVLPVEITGVKREISDIEEELVSGYFAPIKKTFCRNYDQQLKWERSDRKRRSSSTNSKKR